MTALLALLLSLPVSVAAAAPLEPIRVIATSYTCQDHPGNRMFPCGTTRWGADPLTEGMACPVLWAYKAFFVPGQENVLVCDDTPRHASLNGLAHIDLRLPTYDAAVRYGIRRVVVYRVEYP